MKKDLAIIIRYIPQKLWLSVKLSCCFITFMLLQFSITAQVTPKDIKIDGKVNSVQGEPLAGVTVRVKNTTRTTTTDANGNFTLTAPEDAVLEITYVGFKKQELV